MRDVNEAGEFRSTILARHVEAEEAFVHRHADNPGPDPR
jgi:hypothetical protein